MLPNKERINPHLKQKRKDLFKNEDLGAFLDDVGDLRLDFTGVFLAIARKYKELTERNQRPKTN
ncbi:hypothetical protein MACH16_08310 [Marinomonas pontica]|uniref:Uncharacterized protein n=1 Tax=Marinomonas pontica TaxID=264739 RepID=A0ABM8FAK1_9GAMM|nr:hypothetical protein MACH16_08310 [Marinomonas pontica]